MKVTFRKSLLTAAMASAIFFGNAAVAADTLQTERDKVSYMIGMDVGNSLKGIKDEEREPFFSAMSARAADGVRDEIEARGRVKKADALTAQQSIIATAKRLAAEGTISLGDGGDEYV